jgi:hypothetical protein
MLLALAGNGRAKVVAPLLNDAAGDYGEEGKEEKEEGGCRKRGG